MHLKDQIEVLIVFQTSLKTKQLRAEYFSMRRIEYPELSGNVLNVEGFIHEPIANKHGMLI